MPTDIDDRLAEWTAELERQDGKWEDTRRAFGRLGGAPVEVPLAFLEEIDALGRVGAPRSGIRG